MEPPESLYVTCRVCASQIPTSLPLTGAIYEIPLDRPHSLTCQHCGTTAIYTKAQFHILVESKP